MTAQLSRTSCYLHGVVQSGVLRGCVRVALTTSMGQGVGPGCAATAHEHITLWLWEGMWLERPAWSGAWDLVGWPLLIGKPPAEPGCLREYSRHRWTQPAGGRAHLPAGETDSKETPLEMPLRSWRAMKAVKWGIAGKAWSVRGAALKQKCG